jgi:hypothetical protein
VSTMHEKRDRARRWLERCAVMYRRACLNADDGSDPVYRSAEIRVANAAFRWAREHEAVQRLERAAKRKPSRKSRRTP